MWAEERVRNEILHNTSFDDGLIWYDLKYLKSMKDYLRWIWTKEASQLMRKLLPEFEKNFQIISKCKYYVKLLVNSEKKQQAYKELKTTWREFCCLLQFLYSVFVYPIPIDGIPWPKTDAAISFVSSYGSTVDEGNYVKDDVLQIPWIYNSQDKNNIYASENYNRILEYWEINRKMTDADFYDLNWSFNFNQGSFGNCYLVNMLFSLMNTNNTVWKNLCTTSVKINHWVNNSVINYQVFLPLGERNAKPLTVWPSNLENWDLPYWNKVVSIITAAYYNYITHRSWANPKDLDASIAQVWSWWFSDLTAINMLWPKVIQPGYVTHFNRNGMRSPEIARCIRNFNSQISLQYVSFSTLVGEKKTIATPSRRPRNIPFYGDHAYCIADVNLARNTVQLINPHNTSWRIEVWIKDVANFASTNFCDMKINASKIMDNLNDPVVIYDDTDWGTKEKVKVG